MITGKEISMADSYVACLLVRVGADDCTVFTKDQISQFKEEYISYHLYNVSKLPIWL